MGGIMLSIIKISADFFNKSLISYWQIMYQLPVLQ